MPTATSFMLLADIPGSDASHWLLAIALGLIGVGLLWRRRRQIVETTLLGPWWWGLTSVAVLAATELIVALWAGDERVGWPTALRYAAAASTLCPTMALLGAKRPQDRAWSFIVFSLWVVLLLPALHVGLLRPGQSVELPWMWSVFVGTLVVLGVVNYLPTRRWASALLGGAGQVLLLLPHLSSGVVTSSYWSSLLGLALWVASFALLWPRRGTLLPLDRLWLDFRDEFGMFWGMRVLERVNAAADRYEWRVQLGWSGFQLRSGGGPPQPEDFDPVLPRALRNLLRRFVSSRWMASRSQTVAGEPAASGRSIE